MGKGIIDDGKGVMKPVENVQDTHILIVSLVLSLSVISFTSGSGAPV